MAENRWGPCRFVCATFRRLVRCHEAAPVTLRGRDVEGPNGLDDHLAIRAALEHRALWSREQDLEAERLADLEMEDFQGPKKGSQLNPEGTPYELN